MALGSFCEAPWVCGGGVPVPLPPVAVNYNIRVIRWLLWHSDFSKFGFNGGADDVLSIPPSLLGKGYHHTPFHSLPFDAFSVSLVHAHTS